MRQNVGLPFRRCRSMASHGREQKGLDAALLPEIDDRFDNGRDIRDASAAYANGEPAAWFKAGDEVGLRKFLPDPARNIGNSAVRKALLDLNETGKFHLLRIRRQASKERGILSFARLLILLFPGLFEHLSVFARGV